MAWDYDGKEFYRIEDGVQRFYEVPPDLRVDVAKVVHDREILGAILNLAQAAGQLGPVTRERPNRGDGWCNL